MDLNYIVDMYIPIVMVICICVGFVMHKFLPTDNKWIPLTLMILGGIIASIHASHVTVEVVGAGMVTGLASTGLHQVFAQLINNEDNTNKK